MEPTIKLFFNVFKFFNIKNKILKIINIILTHFQPTKNTLKKTKCIMFTDTRISGNSTIVMVQRRPTSHQVGAPSGEAETLSPKFEVSSSSFCITGSATAEMIILISRRSTTFPVFIYLPWTSESDMGCKDDSPS